MSLHRGSLAHASKSGTWICLPGSLRSSPSPLTCRPLPSFHYAIYAQRLF